MSIVLRQATIEDAKLIAEISQQTFYETFAASNTKEDMNKFLEQQFSKGRLMLEVGRRENNFLLAFDKNEVAGYVKLRDEKVPLSLKSANAIEIARLYAMKNKIGKGVGSVLMQACIDIATERKKDYLWLGVWEKNQRAIEFYIKWGFEKFDETDFLLGDDLQNDWLMKKKLK